jgi:uncharacterized protein (PEP-CTERM system associated)
MATMAMAMAKNINKSISIKTAILIPLIIAPSVYAEGWFIVPSLSIDETYTDNVELTIADQTNSFVTQAIAGLSADYKSRLTNLNFNGTKSYAMYSHNSDLNNDFRTLNANGEYSLGASGPKIVASANIANVSRNNADNSLADLVSGDTIETQNYSTGLLYNFGNSSYSVNSSIDFNINRTEDSIGESNGLNAQLGTINGNNARHVYWEMSASYNKRKQDLENNISNNGENYTIDALVGAINRFNFNPFIRFYDEDIKGSGVSQNTQTTSSWGPGIRWLASPHVIIDLSYNFVVDETVSDDYLDVSLQWEPSARTSLKAGYSQRFFGNTYNLDFQHRTRRLTNTLAYTEELTVFDRENYQEVTPDDIELVESNEFSLNRRFSWSSQLKLSRTSFLFYTSASERETLESKVIDDRLEASFTISRTTSPKSTFSLSAKYNYSIFDKDNPEGARQEDKYKTYSASYNRILASSLSSNFTIQHVTRDSTSFEYNYDELRAVINIRKDF